MKEQEYIKIGEFLLEKGVIRENITQRVPWSGGIGANDRIDREGHEKSNWKKAFMEKRKRTHNIDRGYRGYSENPSTTYVHSNDCKVKRPIDFIHPGTSLIIPTANGDQEFKPGNLVFRGWLIKYSWCSMYFAKLGDENI